MKPNQRQLYAQRIERVVKHLENTSFEEETPTLDQLADVAAMSRFHFHRVFRLMTGETVGQALRRLRLARTLNSLAEAETVTQASVTSGYATTQGYARALRREADTSATAARAGDGTLEALAAMLQSPAEAAQGKAAPLAVEVVSIDPFRLLAIRNIGDYAELNAGYSRLFDRVLATVAPEDLRGIYGVPHDDPRFDAPETCRFDCALAVGDAGTAIGELTELYLGGGSHARLRHLGSYDDVPAAIDMLYVSALLLDGQEIGEAPAFVHYLDDPEEVAEPDLQADLYLPLAS